MMGKWLGSECKKESELAKKEKKNKQQFPEKENFVGCVESAVERK